MKRLAILLALLALVGFYVAAQELVYYEGEIRVYERGNNQLFELQDSIDGYVTFGYELDTHYVVRTFGGASAEILLPNGHLLKLDEDTEVELASVVAHGAESGSDVVSVAAGRVRSVVASLTGTGRRFQVNTPSAVGGVRGTDFLTEVLEGSETIAVLEGVVDFANSAGEHIQLAANQFANALGSTFAPETAANIAEQFYGRLNELSDRALQARQTLISALPPTDQETPDQNGEEPGDGTGDQGEEPAPEAPTTTDAVVVENVGGDTEGGEGESGVGIEGPSEPGPLDNFMAGLTEALGFEIGTVTLGGETYSKVIAQPTFQLGRLRMGLYLPIIYTGNLFDPSLWYHPAGNNEWSFGFDQDWSGEPLVAVGDVLTDLALKIRFIEWGDMRDPFFLKVGNLDTLTLGHGLLMNNYANDTDFPTVRRVGLNLGIDFGRFGFEALTNDVARPQILGTRLYARPFGGFPLAVGVSGVVDLGPARDLPSEVDGTPAFEVERATDPIFTNMAVDLDLPVMERDLATLILYGDAGVMVPYLRNAAGGLTAGMQWDVLTGPGGNDLRNYGIASGLMGHVSILDYRLEFQNFHGVFRPAFYDSNYDRIRGEKVRETIAYLQNPADPAYDHQTIGIYGEAGVNIADLVRIDAGYLWPWTRDPDTDRIVMGDNDELGVSLWIQDGLLPYGITAGASYHRTHFVPTLLGEGGFENASLFDEYTVLEGRIVYPVAPIMDIVASVSTQILRDENGDIQYEMRGGELRPVWGPVISIETVLGGFGE